MPIPGMSLRRDAETKRGINEPIATGDYVRKIVLDWDSLFGYGPMISANRWFRPAIWVVGGEDGERPIVTRFGYFLFLNSRPQSSSNLATHRPRKTEVAHLIVFSHIGLPVLRRYTAPGGRLALGIA